MLLLYSTMLYPLHCVVWEVNEIIPTVLSFVSNIKGFTRRYDPIVEDLYDFRTRIEIHTHKVFLGLGKCDWCCRTHVLFKHIINQFQVYNRYKCTIIIMCSGMVFILQVSETQLLYFQFCYSSRWKFKRFNILNRYNNI